MLHSSFPTAIALIDGVSFFASCEQAVNPKLKGKPVVTGKERNIVAAASVEAKALGIKRGVSLWDARKMSPDLVVLPSDYETYSLLSKRMFDIIRTFTPEVEEYSIDEAFADLTGLRRIHRRPYQDICQSIKAAVEGQLGIPVRVGLAPTKTLAKVATEKYKAERFGVVPGRHIAEALADFPVGEVWGIGPNTAALLHKQGIRTAGQFADRSEEYVAGLLPKPYQETWRELRGEIAIPFSTEPRSEYQSISKFKTFTPPSSDRKYVYAQLMKNLENACTKARRYNQAGGRLVVILRQHDFRSYGIEGKLLRPSAYPNELHALAAELFATLFQEGMEYRSTGVMLTHLTAASPTQISLFEEPNRLQGLFGTTPRKGGIREDNITVVVH